MAASSASLRVGNYSLHYTLSGQGHPLVLLHGLAGSSRWWSKNIPVLSDYFQVITLDLAGFGRSRGQRFRLSEAAELVHHWLDMMHIDQCHIIGHSMGGYITTALVSRIPERFDRIVLMDAVVLPMRTSLPVVTLRLLRALRFMPPDFFPVLVGDTARAGPITMRQAIRDILRADLSGELSNIQKDLMIIWGEHDRLLPLDMGYEMHRQLPAARFVVVRGAGHNPMWDRPAVFHKAVIPFLLDGDTAVS
jgi:pimeloyl-ACP methyl ester carboxylesterase